MKNNTYDGYQQLAVAIIKEMYKKPRVIKRMESK